MLKQKNRINLEISSLIYVREITVPPIKKARKGHFLLVEKGRKEATSKNAEEGEGSNPGVRWKEGHPENCSQGAKPAKAAPKASLTAGCSHRFHQNLGRRGKIPTAGK